MPIQVQGQLIDNPSEKPDSRKFRDHWQLEGTVISVDIEAAGKGKAQEVRSRWRKFKEDEGFEFKGKLFHSDKDSRRRIKELLDDATFDEEEKEGSFKIDFGGVTSKMKMDYKTFKELYRASIKHMRKCHEESEKVKKDITAAVKANDVAKLEAIVVKMEDEMGLNDEAAE